ncbi:NAD(P)-dependent oxidoreductase [Desulfonatronovibrio hydrogenovorans]|uniref:NAD(P)-dependent oxidoreductase n=1 Tax=Desulfonatronovibrio hydrogenovorans TaxID=53245 RepID=UPI0005583ED9|nr:NAD(P)-dependent oxidoreductase [Desulfonatronovibrio hydrogenovorans]
MTLTRVCQKPSPENTCIGWVGTGVMGVSMCSHLLDAGYDVRVFNRTREKARPLLDKGAVWVESPGQAAQEADVVLTMVGFPRDVRQVYFGEDGLLEGIRPGGICVDMTTTSPDLSREISQRAAEKKAFALDAPVSGGDVGARNGKLSIMVGGDWPVFEAIFPLFRLMGENILHHGPAGSGQNAKMCNQIIIAGTMIGVCESLVYAAAAGLDPDRVLGSVSKGAAGCWTLNNLAPRILKSDYAPGFMIDHFIKDMGIALEESRRLGICLPGLSLVEELYKKASAAGHGCSGTHALYTALLDSGK